MAGLHLGNMALFTGSTVVGELDLTALELALRELVAGHALLRSRVVTEDDGTQWFHRDDAWRPALRVAAGGTAAYLKLLNTPVDWDGGLIQAHVLRDGESSRVVLVSHHGMSDGRALFAVLGELWQRYTARVEGRPMPIADDDRELPDPIDTRLRRLIDDDETQELIDEIGTYVAATPAEMIPYPLPSDGAEGDPLGRYAVGSLAWDADDTAAIARVARTENVSVTGLLAGASLVAARPLIAPAEGELPLLCGHAIDLRSMVPGLSERIMFSGSAGAGTPALVGTDTAVAEVGRVIQQSLAAAVEDRFPARLLLATLRVHDEETLAILRSQTPTVLFSNIGRVPAHSVPEGLRIVGDTIDSPVPGMPPKLSCFTIGGRLTVAFKYDTTTHSRALVEELRQSFAESMAKAVAAAGEQLRSNGIDLA
ncbi:hypothetical protein AB0N05_25525 [Nocardia sp. NPDC051030]|uniref:phthiocerol/phthiodiolone dimycocerosyl transferase family protein n=1 Tax=Nocardia sp. NPDC051030 TaxID=3155162 RepID=UPI0034315EF1